MAHLSTLDWLLDPAEPSARYRTLTELLDTPADDPEVAAAREGIANSQPVLDLLERMHPDGYWLQWYPGGGRLVGEGVEYGSFGSTHFCLAYLSELGLDRTYPTVARAAERYLNLQQPDGDWLRHLSCLFGYNLRTFLRLGYREDGRLQRTIQLLEHSGRKDGGYLCEIHDTPAKRGKPKSCIRGSLKALAAFSELGPAFWTHPTCLALVDYFLERGGIYQRRYPDQLVHKENATLIFPFTWRAGLVEVLYHLSRMGYGTDPRLERAWRLLEGMTSAEGRFCLDWTPTQSPWKVGRRGEANKWLTLYALLAFKFAGRAWAGISAS